MTYVTEECVYKFLLTARLNQDSLEGIFGMIRGCCGSTDKLDPLLFIQIYRLISFYSLVKPPKVSNVEGVEIFETLMTSKELHRPNDMKTTWEETLDLIIERGENNPIDFNEEKSDNNVNEGKVHDETYFFGFITKKIFKWTACTACHETVVKSEGNLPRDAMINSLSQGYLKYPSDNLCKLLDAVEKTVMGAIEREQLHY